MLFFAGFALGCLCILGMIICRDFGHLNVGKAFVAVLFTGAMFLLQPMLPEWLSKIARDIYTMVPALFWLLCQLAFAYRPKIFSLAGAIALYSFIPPAIANHIGISNQLYTEWVFLAWVLPSYCEYLLIIMGLWTVITNWSDDLVESSRQLRSAVMVGVGLSVLFVIVPMNTGWVGVWLPYLSVCVISLVCSFFLLHGRKGVLFGHVHGDLQDESSVKASPERIDISESNEVKSLHTLMESGFYRTEHLTLKQLADSLGLPEYKTRALINQTLGYRNFNDYINRLRIEEACMRLQQEPDTAILNISLDVGYRTLSSFNRAFKELTGLSPSQYRQQQTKTAH
ncbi:transcriptional regulatory protein [Oceanobacter sp. RED65]|uniref:Transcriptional regulatory protein n=1 Tax=Bermanella marisrubri TaxID=207949 RepID=Q1N1V1_9GAMM|nr:transcriptional regulatory protein [Oceanobacter sp. RED65] [Bermanella marisrubri]